MSQLFSTDIHGNKDNKEGSRGGRQTKPEQLADGKSVEERFRYAYAKYCTSQGIERDMALFKIACLLPEKLNFLDSMFSQARHVTVIDEEFLWEWTDFLMGQRGDRAAGLWLEAGSKIMDQEQMMYYGSKFADRHPSIYRFLCKKLAKQDPVLCEAAAVEALFRIPQDYKIRSDIANLGMMASLKLKHGKAAAAFCQEAFLSDSSIVNYLRLFQMKYQTRPQQLAQNQLERVALQQEVYSTYVEELQINKIDRQQEAFLQFFSGDIMALYLKCSGEYFYNDGSLEFLEISIILMMYAFDRNEPPKVCCKNLVQKAGRYFSRKKIAGFDFQKAMEAWKKKIPFHLPEYEDIRFWLKITVERMTRETMGDGALWDHETAALLVGAFCEMEASNTTENENGRILKRYYERYQDNPSFLKELERFTNYF